MEEFARTIRRELDLAREGRIIARMAGQFRGDPTVRFPAICWELTCPAVLTMEFLEGVKVSAVGTEEAPDLDAAVVAERGAAAMLKQILVHGLFHADPHPGNILVLPGNVVAFIDFGIVGRASPALREQLAETILAIRRHDGDRLAEIVAAVATPLRPVDVPELARDLDEMIDAYADVPMGELALREILMSVTQAMSHHRLKLPADLLLLIKAVSTIEAVGARLDPSFRMVEFATPLVERLLIERYSPAALAHRAADAGHEALTVLRALPKDLAAITRRARTEGLQVQFVHRNFDHFIREMDRSSNRLSFAIVIGAIVIASAVVIHSGAGAQLFGYPAFGVAGFIVAGVLGIGLAIGILRSGRL